jgi:hypothetical protein
MTRRSVRPRGKRRIAGFSGGHKKFARTIGLGAESTAVRGVRCDASHPTNVDTTGTLKLSDSPPRSERRLVWFDCKDWRVAASLRQYTGMGHRPGQRKRRHVGYEPLILRLDA